MLRYFAMFQNRAAQFRDERGATAVEYGLMVALIAAVIIAVVGTLGRNLTGLFTKVSSSM